MEGASASSNLGEPGTKFSRDTFVSTAQLSMPASDVSTIADIDGVQATAGGLTLNSLHIEGTVPEQTQQPGQFGPPQAWGWAAKHRRVLHQRVRCRPDA